MADNLNNVTDEQLNKTQAWRDTLGQAYESTINIHEELLKNIKAVEGIKKETQNVYDLYDKLNELLKKETDLQEKQNDLASKLVGQAQNYQTVIDDGLTARRKQGEELSKLTNITKGLNELIAIQNQQGYTTLDQQNEYIRLLQEKQRVENTINDNKAKEAALLQIVNDKGKISLTNLTEEERLSLQKYLNSVKENEQFKEYIKNHYGSLQAFEQEIELQKASLSNWELINQKLEHINKKVDKFKEIDAVKGTLSFFNTQIAAIGVGFGAIIKNVLAFDHTLTEAAKNLGISVQGARVLADNFEVASMKASDINKNATPLTATIKNQLQAQQEINSALGTALLLTDKERIDQVVITQQMGLQAEEGATLYKLGKLNQTSAEAVTKTVADQVIGARKTLGVQLDYRTVLKDVAKVSGQLAAQYQNNPELLAKAVTQAKALGLEMSQTAAMSDKLLNFQSSIENELEAELLTGKQLNLERARELALRGDSAAAAKELMDNVGGLSEFQKLNVIQQRSLASAIGLGADELADSLKQQEMLKGSAFATTAAFEEAAKQAAAQGKSQEFINSLKQAGNSEEMIAQASQISNQTRFQLAIEKLQETLANIALGPLGTIIDGFGKLMSNANTLKGIMTAIGVIIGGQMLRGIASFGIQMAAAVGSSSAVAASSIATASAITMGVGIVAVIAGIAAAVSALNSATGENISVSAATGGAATNVTPPSSQQGRSGGGAPPAPIVVNAQLSMNGASVQNWTDAQNKSTSEGRFS